MIILVTLKAQLNFFIQKFPLLLLALIYLAAEMIVDPRGNFPLNDDWWYAKLVQSLFLQNSGQAINWSSASVIAQLYFSRIFVYLFGFSHFSLRLLCICLGYLSSVFFYKMIKLHTSLNEAKSIIVTLLFLFNPVYFSLTNSFMSEVPFLFFLLGATYYYLLYELKKEFGFLILSSCFLIAAILTRQIALAFLPAFLIHSYISTKKIELRMIGYFLIPLLMLALFELWLNNHTNTTSYASVFQWRNKVDGEVGLMQWFFNVSKRWVHYLSVGGFTLSPLLLPYLWSQINSHNFKNDLQIKGLAGVICLPVIISIFNFPIGNYVYNLGVGPDTLFDVYILKLHQSAHEHNFIFWLLKAMALLGAYAILLAAIKHSVFLIKHLSNSNTKRSWFFIAAFLMYYSLMCLRSSIFDRYILIGNCFLLFILIPELSSALRYKTITIFFTTSLLLFTVFSSKDYFRYNSIKWQAVEFLKTNYHISDSDVNAGYEHAGWYASDHTSWYPKWKNIPPSTYLLSKGMLPNYYLFTYFTYQRLLPYKHDTVFILKHKSIVVK